MAQAPLTASAIISFVARHEDACEAFYNGLAERFPEEAKAFAKYAKDSAKAKLSIRRTYQETVTDALETNYGFEGVSLASADLDLTLADDATLAQAAAKAVELEKATIALYDVIADAAESLLATIPGAFRRANRRKTRRLAALEALVG